MTAGRLPAAPPLDRQGAVLSLRGSGAERAVGKRLPGPRRPLRRGLPQADGGAGPLREMQPARTSWSAWKLDMAPSSPPKEISSTAPTTRCTATKRGVSSTDATVVTCRRTSSAATTCRARGCGHVNGATGEELARIVERFRKRWPKTKIVVRGDSRPRRDVARRQRCRRPVRPVPQRPPDGARRRAVAQIAQPLRFDQRGAVLRLPLPDQGVVEPHAAGSRESGVASSRRPLRRDLPEPQAGGGAGPLRETPLRARGEPALLAAGGPDYGQLHCARGENRKPRGPATARRETPLRARGERGTRDSAAWGTDNSIARAGRTESRNGNLFANRTST